MDEWNIIDAIICDIKGLEREGRRLVVAIDGKCASGKSTLAAALASRLGANLFCADDFFLPAKMRTAERLSEAGGNMHRERLESEILSRLGGDDAFRYEIYDCANGTYRRSEPVLPAAINIVEGAYVLHPELRSYYHYKIFVDIDDDAQLSRLAARNPQKLASFLSQWIPLENKYIAATNPRAICDRVVTVNGLV